MSSGYKTTPQAWDPQSPRERIERETPNPVPLGDREQGELDEPDPRLSPYAVVADEIAQTVIAKQAAYGDSFGKSGHVVGLLWPDGIPVEAYGDALAVVRVIDKLFRIATHRDAFGEDPWKDVAGYAVLRAVNNMKGEK